jgi:3-oxoacyl-[acyl-carrier-protein] synthase III
MSACKAIIRSTASYLPSRILSNFDLEKMVETSNEWITTRTGISERRIAADNEFPSTMGIHTASTMINNGSLDPQKLDLIIVCTMNGDYPTPSTASLIQHAIGATHAGAFDIQVACSGFVYGLSIAKAFIISRMYNHILLIATEKNSTLIDFTDRNTCILFGDGAGAVYITNEGPGLSIEDVILGSDGEGSSLIQIPAGGACRPTTSETLQRKEHFLKMAGKEVFKHAVLRMEESMQQLLSRNQLSVSDIQWFIPHQANMRIIDALRKRLDFPEERMIITIDKMANTSAATIPIALDRLLSNTLINSGDKIALTAMGAGLAWGSALLQVQS